MVSPGVVVRGEGPLVLSAIDRHGGVELQQQRRLPIGGLEVEHRLECILQAEFGPHVFPVL